jgi:hypothetical protein
LGASSYRVAAGEIDGWSWGPGSLTEALAPPDLTFEQICTDPMTETTALPSQDSEQVVDREALLFFVLLIALLGGVALIVIRRRRAQ